MPRVLRLRHCSLAHNRYRVPPSMRPVRALPKIPRIQPDVSPATESVESGRSPGLGCETIDSSPPGFPMRYWKDRAKQPRGPDHSARAADSLIQVGRGKPLKGSLAQELAVRILSGELPEGYVFPSEVGYAQGL